MGGKFCGGGARNVAVGGTGNCTLDCGGDICDEGGAESFALLSVILAGFTQSLGGGSSVTFYF